MSRAVLASENVTTEALASINGFHPEVVSEVASAVTTFKVVVVGMAMNPFVKKACKALKEAGVEFKYLEYGGYSSKWKPRLAIKLWSGWPTYPQVFVDGKLVGGYKETAAAIKAGKITK